jgi:hypothetical protein
MEHKGCMEAHTLTVLVKALGVIWICSWKKLPKLCRIAKMVEKYARQLQEVEDLGSEAEYIAF